MKTKGVILSAAALLIALILILYFFRGYGQNEALEFYNAYTQANLSQMKELVQRNPKLADGGAYFMSPPLIEAVQRDDYAMVELLVDSHVDINIHERNGEKTALHWAAENGDAKMVNLLLAHGADVNVRDNDGFTPIIHAIKSAEVVKLLLAHGADINATGNGGDNTVYSQTLENPALAGTGVLQMLLANKIDVVKHGMGCFISLALRPDGTDEMQSLVPYYMEFENGGAQPLLEGALGVAMDFNRPQMVSTLVDGCLQYESLPLHRAALKGDDATIRSLLKEEPYRINDKDVLGWTPLHLAAMSNQPRVVEALLANHACVDMQDELGNTPLCWAAFWGHGDVVKILLRYKANMELKGTTEHATTVNGGGNSPLDFAIERGFTAVAIELIENNANLDANNWEGQTPLHVAAKMGNAEVIRSLMAHGAKINASIRSSKERPLDIAVAEDSPESVHLLIANGANLQTEAHEQGGAQATSLFNLWAYRGNPGIAGQLLAAGCDINGRDSEGKTPLFIAVWGRQKTAIQWLLEHHADINAKDKDGVTALHFAAKECGKEVVKLLLDHGADVSAVDNQGRTPLAYIRYYAKQWEDHFQPADYREVTGLLLAHGAKEPVSSPPPR